MTTEKKENEIHDIVIRSEEDAYAILRLAGEGKLPAYRKIIFDGWPTLNINIKGEKFHQSITPKVMRGLLDFQKGIYQSYASAKYDQPTKRLTEEERDALEIRVDVKEGSSDYDINFQELAVKFLEQLGERMDPTEALISVVSIAVLYFGTSAYKVYLENRKEIRLREIADETQRKILESMTFASAQETERMKIMEGLANQNHRIGNISQIAYDAHAGVIKTLAAGEAAEIDGIIVPPSVADSLTKNAKRKSSEVRLDGVYRLIRLDWSDPLKFRVKAYNTDTGLQIEAEVQDDSLTGKYKEALREAEWSRAPVKLQINAKLIGEDSYKDAVVIAAETMV